MPSLQLNQVHTMQSLQQQCPQSIAATALSCRCRPRWIPCRAVNTNKPGTSSTAALLEQQLLQLPGIAAVLPGNEQVKEQVLQTIVQLESHSPWPQPLQLNSNCSSLDALHPVPQLLGDWDLVFASNGTVVTRTQFAQLLASLAKLPGVGLDNITQSLSIDPDTPAGCVSSTNQAVFGLGPLGSWRVTIRGSWRAAGHGHPANTAVVQFDEFRFKLCGFLGAELPQQLPEVCIPLPRAAAGQQQQQPTGAAVASGSSDSDRQQQPLLHVPQSSALRPAALWVTSYLDDTWRVGRGGSSGNVFLFRRQQHQQ